MNSRFFTLRSVVGAALLCAAAVTTRADQSTNSIKFSHPEKPGTVKIAVARGGVRFHGADVQEVVVQSEAQPQHHKRKDGLRVLTESASYTLTEKDNVVTLDTAGDGWMGTPSDFDVTVPKSTNIIVASSLGGDVTCTNIDGDIEIKSLQGEVKLNDISGSAVVDTMNGEITATVRELHDGKALSFTSMNGSVVVRVPETAKANVRLRTQNGTILTDFDEKALVTKVENVGGMRHRRHGVVLSPDVHNAIREASRAGAMAAKEIAQAAREAARAAREGAGVSDKDDDDDDDDHDSDKEASAHPPGVPPVPSVDAIPPIPPVPAIPPVTGGKLVTGPLNGGGPEISIATMNGDVTLRRLEK